MVCLLNDGHPLCDDACDRYTFTIDSEQIPGYTGPPLIVENLTTGNEARFVNDKWQHPSGEANVEAVISWDDDKKVPVVGFLALCTIEEVHWQLIFHCFQH
jgi:hypothetical protein